MPSYQKTKLDGSNDDDDYIRELTGSPAPGRCSQHYLRSQSTPWSRKVITALKIGKLRHKGLSNLFKTRQPVGRTARPGSRLGPEPTPCPL